MVDFSGTLHFEYKVMIRNPSILVPPVMIIYFIYLKLYKRRRFYLEPLQTNKHAKPTLYMLLL